MRKMKKVCPIPTQEARIVILMHPFSVFLHHPELVKLLEPCSLYGKNGCMIRGFFFLCKFYK